MKAFQTAEAGQPLVEASVPAAKPTGTEVLLKTVAVGVCHSDVHLHDTAFDLGNGKSLPVGAPGMTLGHEILGDVVAAGPAARDVSPGDRRVIYPWIGCGACNLCERGDEHLCANGRVIGIDEPGGFAEYVLVPDARYLFDKGDTDDALSCSYACSGLTAFSALRKVGDLGAERFLVVVGAGGVGMNALRIARAVFGARLIVADLDDDKLAIAKSAGAEHTINPAKADASREIDSLTRGGAAAAIDFVGSETSSAFAQRALGKGGTLVIVGLFGGTFSMPLPMIPMLARTICGSYVGSLTEFAQLMDLVRAGRIPPIPIERRPASAESATQALDDLRHGRVSGRAVLVY